MLTAAQIAALKKYGAAFDEECRKAGFASATDFSSKMRRR
jgi:lambda repressor-like predicted transcriptional regulator